MCGLCPCPKSSHQNNFTQYEVIALWQKRGKVVKSILEGGCIPASGGCSFKPSWVSLPNFHVCDGDSELQNLLLTAQWTKRTMQSYGKTWSTQSSRGTSASWTSTGKKSPGKQIVIIFWKSHATLHLLTRYYATTVRSGLILVSF